MGLSRLWEPRNYEKGTEMKDEPYSRAVLALQKATTRPFSMAETAQLQWIEEHLDKTKNILERLLNEAYKNGVAYGASIMEKKMLRERATKIDKTEDEVGTKPGPQGNTITHPMRG